MSSVARGYRTHTAGYPDYWLLLITIMLVLIGLVMVFSASVVVAVRRHLPDNYFFLHELVYAALGTLLMVGLGGIDYRRLRRLAFPLFAVSCLLLVGVLLPHIGQRASGAQRWIGLGPLGTVQPSEIAKLTLAVWLAHLTARRYDSVRSWYGAIWRFLVPTILPALLVMREPDMGTSVIIVLIGLSVYFAAGASPWQLPLIAGGGALGFAAMVATAPYRLERVHVFQTMFLNPWTKSTYNDYHVQQAVLALGSGGPFGLGLGSSRQRFGFLPAPHTDSIFAIIGEELGLVGCSVVILLFVLLAWRGMAIARQSPDRFGALLATGLTMNIVVQAFINIAVVTDSIPFTGVPLPFISFGGSSLIVSLAAIGLLLSISRHSAVPAQDSIAEAEPYARPAPAERARARQREWAFPWALPRAPRPARSSPAFAVRRAPLPARIDQRPTTHAATPAPRRHIPTHPRALGRSING